MYVFLYVLHPEVVNFQCNSFVAEFSYSNMCTHKSLQTLKEHVDLEHQCGYITMLNSNNRHRRRASDSAECSGVCFVCVQTHGDKTYSLISALSQP